MFHTLTCCLICDKKEWACLLKCQTISLTCIQPFAIFFNYLSSKTVIKEIKSNTMMHLPQKSLPGFICDAVLFAQRVCFPDSRLMLRTLPEKTSSLCDTSYKSGKLSVRASPFFLSIIPTLSLFRRSDGSVVRCISTSCASSFYSEWFLILLSAPWLLFLEFKSAAVASYSEPWYVQNESMSSVTYGDLAVDDDLFSEADFDRISL